MASNDNTTFVCLFHNADRAAAALVDAGFDNGSVQVIQGSRGTSGQANTSTADYNNASTGYGNASTSGYGDASGTDLSYLGVPDRDLKHLQEGLAKGGNILVLEALEDRSSEIERIFHHYSADKIDEATLRGSADDYAAPVAAAPVAAAAVSPMTTGTNATLEDQAVVPVVAEELVVGKREVERGGVRVFRRTVEEPVQEAVTLHEEHVHVERRPVDRPLTDADLASASKTIELTETAEVPVVQKVARVVEEVSVGVVGTDRTETVTDTVRHTEVEVEPVTETTTGTTDALNTGTRGNRY